MTPLDYKQVAEDILKTLHRDRDRQIIARRFGFGMAKKQTLEKIGKDFDITRERVRQIEKAAINKIKEGKSPDIEQASKILVSYLEQEAGVASVGQIASKMGAETAGQQAYVIFLASLTSKIDLIPEDDDMRAAMGLTATYNKSRVRAIAKDIYETVSKLGKPTLMTKVASKMTEQAPQQALLNIARLSKQIAEFDNKWGLANWPEVNPKSIRDKTYLVLNKHSRPLHFVDIAERIKSLDANKRNVTVQAVHNELIKDTRFILIGRGIYALAEWGYTPGTVADIIVNVLNEEAPLHKDEIVRRVLMRRQVKTTTIILNLQEKDQFVRIAKATYTLKDK
jgi:hypothetical protein